MVFIVAKWNVIILIKKNMYMKKRKRSGNIDEKKKKYINKRFTDFGIVVCMLTGCSGKSGKEEEVTEIRNPAV